LNELCGFGLNELSGAACFTPTTKQCSMCGEKLAFGDFRNDDKQSNRECDGAKRAVGPIIMALVVNWRVEIIIVKLNGKQKLRSQVWKRI
jgi:hypothetical protein